MLTMVTTSGRISESIKHRDNTYTVNTVNKYTPFHNLTGVPIEGRSVAHTLAPERTNDMRRIISLVVVSISTHLCICIIFE